MVRAVIFWSILLLSITEVYPLRGALIRNGRGFNDGVNNPLSRLLFLPTFQNRGYQEFMRFGRSTSSSTSIDLPGAHQNFYRGRRDAMFDDSDEEAAEASRFG